MLPFSLFPAVTVGDHTLIGVETANLFLAAVFGLALIVGTMWLANRTQPTPNARMWAAVDAVRRDVSAKGRHR